jgi:hypothetical protein
MAIVYVQQSTQHDAFDRCGTARGVIRYLKQHGIKMPVRPHAGPNRGNLEWRRPTRDAVNTVLRHPLYVGTYRYGHRQVDPRRKDPEKPDTGRVVMAITPVLYALGRLPKSTFKPFIFTKEQVASILTATRQLPSNPQFPLRAETCSIIFALLYSLGLRMPMVVRQIIHVSQSASTRSPPSELC